jgi:phenol 2-monooxygenase
MSEVAFWNPKTTDATANNGNNTTIGKATSRGIERTSFVPDVVVAARFQHEITIHQGRIERILEEDLLRYSKHGIVRSTQFSHFELDAVSDPKYPLKITVHDAITPGQSKTVRAKYLVGADGAHSRVRQSMGLTLDGETTDHIWGVLDFVAETDFPDVRKRCAIHSDAGSIMIIPREKINSGHYLTRLYVQILDEVPTDVNDNEPDVSTSHKTTSKQRRAAVTLDYILNQANKVLYPYNIRVKSGTEPDWYAAYQIGQRMAREFSMKDSEGAERVFIVGDGKFKFLSIQQIMN